MRNDNKVIVIDSIMGSGKTSAIIQMVNNNQDKKYIYVTPYLTEIERIIQATDGNFQEPKPYEESKIDNFHTLLNEGVSIATTHALFLNTNEETTRLINDNNYILILDEALDVFQEYNNIVEKFNNKQINFNTIQWLIDEGCLSIDKQYLATWNNTNNQKDYEDFHYSEVKRLCENQTLYCIDKGLFWIFDPKIFTAFNTVYILTYQYKGTLFDSYMRMHNIDYIIQSVIKDINGEYKICEYIDDTQQRKELSKLIHIYEGELNNIGNHRNAFSTNWLNKKTKKEDIKIISSNMRKYKSKYTRNNTYIMWTTSKRNGINDKLVKQGFKYTRKLTKSIESHTPLELKRIFCFVPCNSKGTNEYKDRTILLYMLNKFLNPQIKKYFQEVGYPINEEVFALNELIQWVFRSAIREGKEINLYIPSKRMRNLLYKWLNYTPPICKSLEKTP